MEEMPILDPQLVQETLQPQEPVPQEAQPQEAQPQEPPEVSHFSHVFS